MQIPCVKARSAPTRAEREAHFMVAAAGRSVNPFAEGRVKLPNKRGGRLRSVHRVSRMVSMGAHSHGNDHPGHSHDHDHTHAHPTLRPAVLGWAMAATLGLVVAEVFGGILGRSVAL